jgi:hypothetical protein
MKARFEAVTPLVKSSLHHSWSEEQCRLMLGVFAPLGYDILKSE